jgi:hypothetical protein
LKNQNLEFNITDSNKLRYFVQKEKEFIDMTQTNQVGEELEGIEDMPIREEE